MIITCSGSLPQWNEFTLASNEGGFAHTYCFSSLTCTAPIMNGSSRMKLLKESMKRYLVWLAFLVLQICYEPMVIESNLGLAWAVYVPQLIFLFIYLFIFCFLLQLKKYCKSAAEFLENAENNPEVMQLFRGWWERPKGQSLLQIFHSLKCL